MTLKRYAEEGSPLEAFDFIVHCMEITKNILIIKNRWKALAHVLTWSSRGCSGAAAFSVFRANRCDPMGYPSAPGLTGYGDSYIGRGSTRAF
jgi:hypothetical protein